MHNRIQYSKNLSQQFIYIYIYFLQIITSLTNSTFHSKIYLFDRTITTFITFFILYTIQLEQNHTLLLNVYYFLPSTSFQNLTKREFCKFYIIKYTHAPTRPERKKEIFLLIHQSVFISKASRRLEGNESDVPVVRKKRKEGEKEEKGTISTRFTDLRRADSSRKLVSVDQVPSWRLKRTGVPTRVKRKPFLSAPRLSGSCPIMPFPASTSTSEKRRNST